MTVAKELYILKTQIENFIMCFILCEVNDWTDFCAGFLRFYLALLFAPNLN